MIKAQRRLNQWSCECVRLSDAWNNAIAFKSLVKTISRIMKCVGDFTLCERNNETPETTTRQVIHHFMNRFWKYSGFVVEIGENDKRVTQMPPRKYWIQIRWNWLWVIFWGIFQLQQSQDMFFLILMQSTESQSAPLGKYAVLNKSRDEMKLTISTKLKFAESMEISPLIWSLYWF